MKPILFYNKESRGSIRFFNGELRNIMLEYDTFLDELVYTDSTRYSQYPYCKITLNRDSFICFTLNFGEDTMVFKYLKPEDEKFYNLKEGFYEVVYEGKSRYIVKHQSSVAETNSVKNYYYKPVLYLLTGSSYTRIKSSKKLISLLAAGSPDLTAYITANNINRRSPTKKQIIGLLKYYDSSLPDKDKE